MSEINDLLVEADDYEKNVYFLERDIEEDEFKIFYNAPKSFLWKNHPENPFKVSDVIEWKKKAEILDDVVAFVEHFTQIYVNAPPASLEDAISYTLESMKLLKGIAVTHKGREP